MAADYPSDLPTEATFAERWQLSGYLKAAELLNEVGQPFAAKLLLHNAPPRWRELIEAYEAQLKAAGLLGRAEPLTLDELRAAGLLPRVPEPARAISADVLPFRPIKAPEA